MEETQSVVQRHIIKQSHPARKKHPTPSVNNRSRLIRLPEVKARVGLSRSTIYSRIKTNDFPTPVRLGEKSVAWLESSIDDFINSLLPDAEKEVA